MSVGLFRTINTLKSVFLFQYWKLFIIPVFVLLPGCDDNAKKEEVPIRSVRTLVVDNPVSGVLIKHTALLIAPFGLIGVVAAMLPTGTPMGFVAILGVIALSGMIIRNAVILIEEVEVNRAQGADNTEAIIEAALHRSRPILLTACAAILGMIPIAFQVFWGPMAYAIIGGLLVATIFTLTVLPAAISAVLQWETSR